MPLHKTQRGVQSVGVRLAAALDDRMTREGRSNVWLGSQIGKSKFVVGRLRSGETEMSVDRVRAIETALGLGLGDMLREAGYFEPIETAGVTRVRRLARDLVTQSDTLPIAASGKAKPRRGTPVTKPQPPAK